jgi:hypothetical protein
LGGLSRARALHGLLPGLHYVVLYDSTSQKLISQCQTYAAAPAARHCT